MALGIMAEKQRGSFVTLDIRVEHANSRFTVRQSVSQSLTDCVESALRSGLLLNSIGR